MLTGDFAATAGPASGDAIDGKMPVGTPRQKKIISKNFWGHLATETVSL